MALAALLGIVATTLFFAGWVTVAVWSLAVGDVDPATVPLRITVHRPGRRPVATGSGGWTQDEERDLPDITVRTTYLGAAGVPVRHLLQHLAGSAEARTRLGSVGSADQIADMPAGRAPITGIDPPGPEGPSRS